MCPIRLAQDVHPYPVGHTQHVHSYPIRLVQHAHSYSNKPTFPAHLCRTSVGPSELGAQWCSFSLLMSVPLSYRNISTSFRQASSPSSYLSHWDDSTYSYLSIGLTHHFHIYPAGLTPHVYTCPTRLTHHVHVYHIGLTQHVHNHPTGLTHQVRVLLG